jgi:predicted Zn finger-like uncharacterized protein
MEKRLLSAAKGPAHPTQSRSVGTVEVSLNADSTRLIGTCPRCGSRLSVDLRTESAHGRLVSCTRCKEIYRVMLREGLQASSAERCGLGVSYAVEGEWDVGAIMEYLFDNIGMVDYVRGGFVCHPDEETPDFPSISVDEQSRLVRFGLFGAYQEQEAGSIINQTVSEFGARFQVEMRPVLLERWEYRDGDSGFALVERRPLGTLLKDRATRQANA